ncbi:MAG: hypothetical protein K6G52_06655 [Treponemataceae bacterium]|nr:hypothetical protein [Treponemataceae bacterium]
MKLKISLLSLLSVLAVFSVLSCSDFYKNSTEREVSVSISSELYQSVKARTPRSTSTYNIIIEVFDQNDNLLGSDEQVLSYSEQNFSLNVKVGLTVYAVATIHCQGNVIYTGKSSTLKISKGTNNLELVLDYEDGTPYALYTYNESDNTSNSTYQFYLVDSPSDVDTSSSSSYGTYTTLFCFDSNGYFYIVNDTAGTTVYSSNPVCQNVEISSSGLNLGDGNYGITVDTENDILYGYTINDATLNLYKYPSLISEGTVDDVISYEINFDDDSSYFYHSKMVVNNGILYDYDGYTLAIVSLPKTSASITAADSSIEVISSDSDSEVTYSVNDILYQDGAVYILESYNSTDSDIYSNGFVAKVSISDETVSFAGSENATDSSSITNIATSSKFYAYVYTGTTYEHLYNNVEYDDGSYIVSDPVICSYAAECTPNIYAPSTTTASSFLFGPQKFIAVKPKKLVVSDEGLLCYTNSDGALVYKNVNRIVTIDLETFAIKKIIDTSVTFENNESSTFINGGSFDGGNFFDYVNDMPDTSYISNGSSYSSGNSDFTLGIPLGE